MVEYDKKKMIEQIEKELSNGHYEDFYLPDNFDLTYVKYDSEKHTYDLDDRTIVTGVHYFTGMVNEESEEVVFNEEECEYEDAFFREETKGWFYFDDNFDLLELEVE